MFFGQKEIPDLVEQTDENVNLSRLMFPEMHQATLNVVVNEGMKKKAPIQFMDKRESHLFFNTSIDNLMELIVQELEMKKNSVWIGYDHNSNFVDNASGAMTIKGFGFNPVNPYMTRKERDRYQIYDGGHAVQIVGVRRAKSTPQQIKRGEKGNIVAFVMQNSWGEKAGQKGIYLMGVDYFRAFIWNITLRDETGQIAQAAAAAASYDKKKVRLSLDEFKAKLH